MKYSLLIAAVLLSLSAWSQDLALESPNKRKDPDWFKYNESYGFLSTSLAIDAQGNIYTGGTFENVFASRDTFYEMPRTPFRNTSPNYPFIQKHKSNGDLQWMAYAEGQARLHDLVVSTDSAVFITGEVWSDDLVFVSSNGQRDSLPKAHKQYERGLYLARFNAQGIFQGAVFYSDLPHANGSDLAIDSEGRIWVAGNYMYRQESELKRNWLLLRFSTQFEREFVFAGDSTGRSGISAIALDGRDQVYLGGWFSSHLNFFDQSIDVEHGTQKSFVAKLNSDGELRWCNTAITDPHEMHSQVVINEIEVDFWHRIYLSGSTFSRYFLAQLERDGELDWMKRCEGRSSYPFGMEWADKDLIVYGHGYGSSFKSRSTDEMISYQAVASTDGFILVEGWHGKLKEAIFLGGEGTDYVTALKWHEGKIYVLGHNLGGRETHLGKKVIPAGRPKMWLASWSLDQN